ncbi:MAG: hypothetical protein JST26_05620 [Bacteroidetes bacterium]|nr:hypothetical protein [Bacteroidota bacterium]
METYTKVHTSKKVADIHLAKIKKRGGKATVKDVKGGIQIEYYFPEKASGKKQAPKMLAAKKTDAKKKSEKSKRYDVISPDGITIRIGVPPFKTTQERAKYFEKWKDRFARQGYYSSNRGPIQLEDLAGSCEWITL